MEALEEERRALHEMKVSWNEVLKRPDEVVAKIFWSVIVGTSDQ